MKNTTKKTQAKDIIICKHCGTRQRKAYIAAMDKAGFGLRHIACRECGQHALGRIKFTTN